MRPEVLSTYEGVGRILEGGASLETVPGAIAKAIPVETAFAFFEAAVTEIEASVVAHGAVLVQFVLKIMLSASIASH